MFKDQLVVSFFMSEVQFGHRLCEKFVVLIVQGEHRSEMIDGVLRSRLLKGRGDYTAFRYCFSLTLIYISAQILRGVVRKTYSQLKSTALTSLSCCFLRPLPFSCSSSNKKTHKHILWDIKWNARSHRQGHVLAILGLQDKRFHSEFIQN